MNNDKEVKQAISNGELQAQADSSYVNWLIMNEYTFDQAMQLLMANKMQNVMYEKLFQNILGQ